MKSMTRRSAFAVFAAAMVAPLAAYAQGATNAPAGGVGSSTAPSNSAGTPAGGTGVLSTTRVGPATTTPAAAPPRRARRRTRRTHTPS